MRLRGRRPVLRGSVPGTLSSGADVCAGAPMAFRQGWMRLRAQSHHICFHYTAPSLGGKDLGTEVLQRRRNGLNPEGLKDG